MVGGRQRWRFRDRRGNGLAVGTKDGDRAGEEHRTEVSYQVTRWSNTYSGVGGGMSSQWNWDDRPRSRGCTWVYEIVGKFARKPTPASGRLGSSLCENAVFP